MTYLDLTERINHKVLTLTDRTVGVNLRYDLGLEQLDNSKEPITVLFPTTVRAIGPNFFFGLFGHSIIRLGKDKFRKHYLFDDPDTPHLRSSIEAGIAEAWAMGTKPEPDLVET